MIVKHTKRLALAAACALAASSLFPTAAFAQATGNVDVDINLQNGITILYYYSSVRLMFTSTDE